MLNMSGKKTHHLYLRLFSSFCVATQFIFPYSKDFLQHPSQIDPVFLAVHINIIVLSYQMFFSFIYKTEVQKNFDFFTLRYHSDPTYRMSSSNVLNKTPLLSDFMWYINRFIRWSLNSFAPGFLGSVMQIDILRSSGLLFLSYITS